MRRVNPARTERGFTLVELMVALSGGLLLAVFVFMLASQGSRFYRREGRMADATISAMNGFDRMRADIARAAFLSSPNIALDKFVCRPSAYTNPGLANLAAVRFTLGGSATDASTASDMEAVTTFWNGAGLDPDSLLLAGSYASADRFPAAEVIQEGSGEDANWRVVLQPNSGAMARLGYRTSGTQSQDTRLALLSSVFASGRVLRIVDKKGSHHYGIIDTVGMATQANDSGTDEAPFIDLTNDEVLVQDSVNSTCGLQGLNVGATVNVVNFIRYRLERLSGNSDYDPIYADPPAGSYEETRTELVRTEMQPDGTSTFAGTEELVAEYAVDLKFGITHLQLTTPPKLTRVAEGDADGFAAAAPHLIRAVHARLGVRSREGDREADVPAGFTGLYRVPLNNGQAPFARVRTLQADIALRNNYGVRW